VKFLESITIALRSLFANKLRSSLTMLGIIIGVGSVITLMSVGQGAEASITSTYEELGTNLLTVMPSSSDVEGLAGMSPAYATPTLTMDDVKALERVPFVTAIVPVNENFVKLTYEGESKTSVIHGTTPEYLQAYGYSLAAGQFISERQIGTRDMVIVLGSEPAEALFGSQDPIGKTVKLKGYRFTVIGVLEKKGGAMMGFSLDNIVQVPITTYQTRLFTQKTATGEDAVASIAVKVAGSEYMDEVKGEIEDILRQRHRIAADEKNDFSVVSQEQMLSIITQVTGIFTIVLGAIASISLLVGGIGIMNIMLVSVTERTREIGIRKAVGAKRRDILMQFLLEAAALSFVGGGIGIAGGWLLAFGISRIDLGGMKIAAAVTPDIVILAVSVSIFIGLASGVYPAMRAARLNPIDALHYE
jgi:putative ABC transport system permease protein